MTHHAFVYYQNSLDLAVLPDSVRVPGADVEHIICEKLDIGTVRNLIRISHTKPIETSHRDFVIVSRSINREAQNALLKILEEPPPTSRFHLVIPSPSLLLPTVLSRLQEVQVSQVDDQNEVFNEFMKLEMGERLAAIQTKLKEKDIDWSEAILAGARKYAVGTKTGESLKQTLKTTELYFHRNGSSKKMLLENLAIHLP